MLQYQYQLVCEFYHYKFMTNLLPGKVSKKIIVHLEGFYRNKVVRSTEYRLEVGVQLALPWSDRLDQVQWNFFYIDDQLKVELGYAVYHIPNQRGFSFDEPNRIIIEILPNGGMSRIGRAICLLSVERLYADESEPPKIKSKADPTTYHIDTAVPGFRFRRLSKAVNWNKMRVIDLNRVIEMNDVSTILSCVDDVALGDAAEEGN
jgi:hypothetical protein